MKLVKTLRSALVMIFALLLASLAATGRAAAQNVQVNLPRSFRYRLPGQQRATTYNAGPQEVPEDFARNLVQAGLLNAGDFGEESDYLALKDGEEIIPKADDTIPDEAPGAEALRKAGITWAELADIDDFTTIDGIGQKTAERLTAFILEHTS